MLPYSLLEGRVLNHVLINKILTASPLICILGGIDIDFPNFHILLSPYKNRRCILDVRSAIFSSQHLVFYSQRKKHIYAFSS